VAARRRTPVGNTWLGLSETERSRHGVTRPRGYSVFCPLPHRTGRIIPRL
jgi:hypothetical protein